MFFCQRYDNKILNMLAFLLTGLVYNRSVYEYNISINIIVNDKLPVKKRRVIKNNVIYPQSKPRTVSLQ